MDCQDFVQSHRRSCPQSGGDSSQEDDGKANLQLTLARPLAFLGRGNHHLLCSIRSLLIVQVARVWLVAGGWSP